jgi:large subunit ribosomal protein L17e
LFALHLIAPPYRDTKALELFAVTTRLTFILTAVTCIASLYRMVRYSVEPEVPEKVSKSRGSHLRVHFKHCREIAHYTKGMKVNKALKILDDVLAFKAVIPFVRFTGGIGRKAMAKQCNAPGDKGRFPVKATAVYRDLLKNAVSNAEIKGLDVDNLVIDHAQVNQAPAGRRRTYRAHGRIGKYASQPAHIEIMLKEVSGAVEKAAEDTTPKRISKKDAARRRFVKIGAPAKAAKTETN